MKLGNDVSQAELPTPLELTKAGRDISVTERGSFRSCRRRWHLDTIQNWTPRQPQWALTFGTGIHAALEAYYKAQRLEDDLDPEEQMFTEFDVWYDEEEKNLANELGPLFTSEAQQEFYDLGGMGVTMLENYLKFDALTQKKDPWEILAVEGEGITPGQVGYDLFPGNPYNDDAMPIVRNGRVMVPIVDPETKEVIQPVTYLTGRIDLIVQRKSPYKGIWVVDHKTTGSQPNDRGIDFEDQITGYSYIIFRLLGIIIRGTIFNYLVKQLPKEPRINKTKPYLSAAKDQLCLAPAYREALLAYDLMDTRGKILSAAHAECYEALLSKGWDPYFKRFSVQRNQYEIEAYEHQVFDQLEDMRETYENPERKAYPNKSAWHCPSCAMAPVCQAMDDGSDWEDVIEHRYMQAPDRKAV